VANDKDPFDDLFEPFELEEGPPPPGSEPPPQSEPVTPSVTEPAPQVDCPSCGATNPAYNRHCEQCGARLTSEPLPLAPAPMVRATPGSRALSVLAAAVLLVALGALLVNIFGGKNSSATPTTNPGTTTTTKPIVAVAPIIPTSASASFEISAGFDASHLIDDDLTTEWQAPSKQTPLTVTFNFAQPVQLQYIELYNITDENRFLRNYRINGYKITVDDLPGVEIRNNLRDASGGPQRIDIASVGTRSLTIEILSTYASQAVGTQPAFEEVALAEVKFFGTSE